MNPIQNSVNSPVKRGRKNSRERQIQIPETFLYQSSINRIGIRECLHNVECAKSRLDSIVRKIFKEASTQELINIQRVEQELEVARRQLLKLAVTSQVLLRHPLVEKALGCNIKFESTSLDDLQKASEMQAQVIVGNANFKILLKDC